MASPDQQPTTIEDLTGELLSEILIRLPAKPLAQMRSVSKPWNDLLSKPSFIKSHLHRSLHNNNNNNDEEILLVLADGDIHDPFLVTSHFSRSPHLELHNFIKLPVISWSESTTVKFLGSVNGLICFSFETDNHFDFQIPSYNDLVIQIWNPSLSTVLTLPPCQLPYWNFGSTKTYFRFGYDPNTDDYKLVKLMIQAKEWQQVEMYSLRNDSWGLITQRFPSHVTEIFNNQDKVCVDGYNGRLHWLCSFGEGRKVQTIVAFDLGMETFSEISLPESVIDHNKCCWESVGVMAGKLCVMSCIKNENLECEIWVMNEYGVGESWVKHHVLSQLTGVLCPYGFTFSNKFLFATVDGRFSLYDPVSANIKNMASLYRAVKIVPYVQSLVWIAPVRSG